MKTHGTKYRSPHFRFRSNPETIWHLSLFLMVTVLQLAIGCSYYKVKEVPITKDTIAPQIKAFNSTNNYVILNQLWQLKDLQINEADQTLTGRVDFLSAQHTYTRKRENKKTYMIKKDQQPFNELNFVVDLPDNPKAGTELTIPFSAVKSLRINTKNTGRTILNVAGTTVGVLFIAAVIYVATSSCPFAYINDGDGYVFMGELYPGTITPNMQHFDYLPLPNFNSINDRWEVKVTNELKEVQNTDFLQLWVVEHKKGTTVVLDKFGKVQGISREILPKKVFDANYRDVRHSLEDRDGIFYSFGDDIPTTTSTRQIDLQFDIPQGQQKAKLVLNAKNSMWLDYVFGKFNAQFGAYYPQFQKDQLEIPASKSEQWLTEQHIPLSVSIKTDLGWELVDQINTVGPLATRDLIVPIDLGKINGDTLEVRLECGFMFWDIDYASLDVSENTPLLLTKIAPDTALDENNVDVTSLLQKADGIFYSQPEIGNAVVLGFKAPQRHPGMQQSVFLVNKGYYTYIRNYDGIPNFSRLKSFREADTFTRFSENAYKAIMALAEPVNDAL
jgi:hypothetical protein